MALILVADAGKNVEIEVIDDKTFKVNYHDRFKKSKGQIYHMRKLKHILLAGIDFEKLAKKSKRKK